jgi:heme A synthase
MNDMCRLVPGAYFKLEEFLKNFTENPANVQFNHRIFAYLTWSAVSGM